MKKIMCVCLGLSLFATSSTFCVKKPSDERLIAFKKAVAAKLIRAGISVSNKIHDPILKEAVILLSQGVADEIIEQEIDVKIYRETRRATSKVIKAGETFLKKAELEVKRDYVKSERRLRLLRKKYLWDKKS